MRKEKTYCDRCKEECTRMKWTRAMTSMDEVIDLCKRCNKEFCKFMKQKKQEDGG